MKGVHLECSFSLDIRADLTRMRKKLVLPFLVFFFLYVCVFVVVGESGLVFRLFQIQKFPFLWAAL